MPITPALKKACYNPKSLAKASHAAFWTSYLPSVAKDAACTRYVKTGLGIHARPSSSVTGPRISDGTLRPRHDTL